MVAAGGLAHGAARVGVHAVVVLPMVMLKLVVAVANTCHPLSECARRVVLCHWQHGAQRRVVLSAGNLELRR